MTSKDITPIVQEWLFKHSHIYQATNYQRGFWESDILGITKAFISTEIEIKISRSDFFADLKKTAKHFHLEKGFISSHWNIPNRFYYTCPDGLIKISEVPKYCGLLYVSSDIEVIKKAPMIHNGRIAEKILLKMFALNTEKNIFGCSYLTHKNRQARKLYDEHFNS